jgi:hypothetical protein
MQFACSSLLIDHHWTQVRIKSAQNSIQQTKSGYRILESTVGIYPASLECVFGWQHVLYAVFGANIRR